MEKIGSNQEILSYERISGNNHFTPGDNCPGVMGGRCDMEVVKITNGNLKGRLALVTWGLNIPIETARQPSCGLNQHRLVKSVSPDVAQDVCEILIATQS